jgi:hypothetical protein
MSPLHTAVGARRQAVVETLLAARCVQGAGPSACLLFSAEHTRRADVNLRNGTNETAYDIAYRALPFDNPIIGLLAPARADK